MKNQDREKNKILKLLDAGCLIRVLDGRCRDGFVNRDALKSLIDEKKVETYRVNGLQFARKLERK